MKLLKDRFTSRKKNKKQQANRNICFLGQTVPGVEKENIFKAEKDKTTALRRVT